MKQRRARSKILHLKTDEGTITEDSEVIESTIVNHFKNQFSEIGTSSFHSLTKELKTLPIPKIDQHQQATLDMLVTDDKIERAVFQLGPHKAPRPDEILPFFYHGTL